MSVTLSGTFLNPDGSNIGSGTLILTLSQSAVETGTGWVVPSVVKVPLTNGAIPGATTVLGNDALTPAGTVYWASILTSTGFSWSLGSFSITGSSFNFNDAVPVSQNLIFPPTTLAIKPAVSDALQYLSANGNDSNDGLSWGTAKLTIGAFISYTGVVKVAAGNYTFGDTTFTGGVVFDGEPGATFSGNVATSRLQFTAANSGIVGCILTGPGSTGTLQACMVTADNFVFRNNTVTNWGNSSSNGTLEITGGSGHKISGNKFSGNVSFDIFVVAPTAGKMSNISVVDNVVGEIIVHTNVTGAFIDQIVVSGNILSPGQKSKTEFGIEIGAFGGETVTNVVVNGNSIVLSASGTDGGISIGNCKNFAVTGNTFDSSGFTYTVNGIEIATASTGVVSGNTVIGTGGNGMDLDHSSNVAMTGNSINGFATASGNYGIFIGVTNTATPLAANNNTVCNNTISFSTGGAGNGIFMQCNEASGTVNDNIVMGNVITSDGTIGSVGIKVENDSGTMSGNLIAGNIFDAPATSYSKSGTAVMATFVTET